MKRGLTVAFLVLAIGVTAQSAVPTIALRGIATDVTAEVSNYSLVGGTFSFDLKNTSVGYITNISLATGGGLIAATGFTTTAPLTYTLVNDPAAAPAPYDKLPPSDVALLTGTAVGINPGQTFSFTLTLTADDGAPLTGVTAEQLARTILVRFRGLATASGTDFARAAQPFAYVLGQRDDPAPGNSGVQVVSVIDTSSNAIVATIPVGLGCLCIAPDSLAISPDGQRVYVANEVANSVSVIDTASNAVLTTIAVGSGPTAVAASPDGTRVYALNGSGVTSVSVIDAATNTVVSTIPLAVAQARGMAITPDGSRLYVSNYGANSVKVIDTSLNSILTTIGVSTLPVGVDVTPDGSFVYVADFTGNAVSVISTASNTVVATVPVGTGPESARIKPGGTRTYVANLTASSVSVINTPTNTVATTVAVTSNPRTLEFTPDGIRAFVANDANVQIISTASNTVTTTIPFDEANNGHPAAIVIGPRICASCPTLTLTPAALNIGVVNSGGTLTFKTPDQTLALTQSGAGTVPWTIAASQPWITVSPTSGTGPATLTVSINNTGNILPASGSLSGTITVNTNGAANAPAAAVKLTVVTPPSTAAPAGAIDTPTPGQGGITGSLAVTGWAIDDIGVMQVEIFRGAFGSEPPDQQVFIGTAVFVNGARPDIANTFPSLPLKDQAGWGYLMLTNFLPNQGNGTFTLYVYAEDVDGHRTLLGTRTITCTNATATVPFGAIDTPVQGGTVSGSTINFGWALAAQPTASGLFIPYDGSTVQVYVDSILQGTATYNNARTDIQTLFPGYANTDGAVGYRALDTTTFANGVHTIFWIVSDNVGGAAGIGSRYFTVLNSTGTAVRTETSAAALTSVIGAPSPTTQTALRAAAVSAPSVVALKVRHGFTDDGTEDLVLPAADGVRYVRTAQLDRVVIDLAVGAAPGTEYRGYAIAPDGIAALPIGSHLDAAAGVFAWAPGLAFGGTHALVFVRSVHGQDEHLRVDVAVDPHTSTAEPQLVIDIPGAGEVHAQPFTIAGWAVDSAGPSDGSGIDTLHVWAYPVGGGAPRWVGVAAYGGARPDVAAIYGPRFGRSGFAIDVATLPSGTYDVVVYGHSIAQNRFTVARTVRVAVR